MNFKAILKAIKANKTFVISTHVSSDIDGLSSELVMALYLKSLGKKVRMINAEKVSRMHMFLPGARHIEEYKGQAVDYDAAIVLDCGDFDRIDKVKKIIKKDKPLINIDHHITNDHFGTVNLVDPQASSTAEVIFELLEKAKFPLTKNIAILLYLGIMTDTGSFRYDSTTARSHEIVSRLMKFKFFVSHYYKKIYETIPLNDLRMLTKVMSSFEITHNGKVASVMLPKKIYEKFSGEFDLRERIFTFLRTIKGVDVIVIFTEGHRHLTRINFRSQGKADVAKLASYFNGGGHKKASGGKIFGNLNEAKRRIFASLNKVLK